MEALLARQAQLQAERDRLERIISAEQRAPKADWTKGTFPWDARVAQLLSQTFGIASGFRPLQREVINATLQRRDVLCLLPSGGGKSLCYQLPALADSPGVTLVISPLLSLIQVRASLSLTAPLAAATHSTANAYTSTVLAQQLCTVT